MSKSETKRIETLQDAEIKKLRAQLESARAAIGHLREAAKSGNKDDIEHALSATSGYTIK